MNRRDLLFGAGCVAALAGAEALRPRTLLSLASDRKFTTMLPVEFAGWRAEGGGDMVIPEVPGSLADTLYNETVARTYRREEGGADAGGGAPVLLLAAHGDSQSDLLQLHRPETCYQAIGFSIEARRFDPVPLAGGAALPAVQLVARAGERYEDILYWTRLGEYLPTTDAEQRRDRLRTAMDGHIADGVLVRMSSVRGEGAPDWERLKRFAADMIRGVAPADRPALIGTGRAAALRGGGSA